MKSPKREPPRPLAESSGRAASWPLAAGLALTLALSALLGACAAEGNGADEAPKVSVYPEGPYGFEVGEVLPDLTLDGASEDHAFATIRLQDYFAPSADVQPGLFVIELHGGLWCGTCRWYAENLPRLLGPERASRIRRLTVIVGDRDNAPAQPQDALAWQSLFASEAVAVDPGLLFGASLAGVPQPLPLFIVVDPRSMRVQRVLSNPPPGEWTAQIESALAEIDGAPAAPVLDEPLVDGLLYENEWQLLQTTTLPQAPPADPSNAFADAPLASELGKLLYFDTALSPSGTVSCATCHDPARGFSDDRPLGQGVATGRRRSPSLLLSAHSPWQFWDGRADSLWAQALGPFEDPAEFGATRSFVARRVLSNYPARYQAAFASELPETSAWPEHGKPGDSAYDALPDAERLAITRVFVNVGKAIAAYERSLRVLPNRLDRYLSGDFAALDAEEKYGLQLFARSGCLQCHWGPRLTDDAFHNTRTPSGSAEQADRGRADGLLLLQNGEFRRDGSFSDSAGAAPERAHPAAGSEAMAGQFKTPALRGVANLRYFGHAGVFEDLAGVTEAYGRGGAPESDANRVGTREPWLMHFGETAAWGMVPLLEVLTADLAPE